MSEEGFTEETSEPCAEGSGVTIDDFVAYMPQHVYIFMPCREPWPAASINARLGKVPVMLPASRAKSLLNSVIFHALSKQGRKLHGTQRQDRPEPRPISEANALTHLLKLSQN